MAKGARSQLASKLRLLRVARRWSQEDLASHSGLHRTHISLIERSACNVGLDNLERLAATFGLTPSELLNAEQLAEITERAPLAAHRVSAHKTPRKKRSR